MTAPRGCTGYRPRITELVTIAQGLSLAALTATCCQAYKRSLPPNHRRRHNRYDRTTRLHRGQTPDHRLVTIAQGLSLAVLTATCCKACNRSFPSDHCSRYNSYDRTTRLHRGQTPDHRLVTIAQGLSLAVLMATCCKAYKRSLPPNHCRRDNCYKPIMLLHQGQTPDTSVGRDRAKFVCGCQEGIGAIDANSWVLKRTSG